MDLPKPIVSLVSLEGLFGTAIPSGVLTATEHALTAYSLILALVTWKSGSWAINSFLGGNNDSSSISKCSRWYFHILNPEVQEKLETVCNGRKSAQLGMLGFKKFCTETTCISQFLVFLS